MSDKKLFSNFCKKAKIKHPLLISDISKIKKINYMLSKIDLE